MPLSETSIEAIQSAKTGEYFRRLRLHLKLGLTAGLLIPLLILLVNFNFQFHALIIISCAILFVFAVVLWFFIDTLLNRARAIAESKEVLRCQLIHASKLATLGELAAGVAHEINNPLAIIAAETGVLRDMMDPQFNMDHSPESIIKELDQIDTAVYRARNITKRLLNFSRMNNPRPVLCDLNEILDEVASGLKESDLLRRRIRLVRDYARDLPDVVIDPDEIGQVFLNLINNAGDAIGEDGTITLATRHRDGFVRVTVTDTGKGMGPAEKERIFTPFYTTKDPGKGTGLGLSISLNIVESFGGSIELQSAPAAGSSFTVVLPTSTDADEKDDKRQQQSS